MKTKWVLGFSIVIALILLGYFREFTFLNINYQLWAFRNPEDPYIVHPVYLFLQKWPPNRVFILKWPLTFAFSMVFMGLSIIGMKAFYPKIKSTKLVVITYFSIIILAAATYALGYVLNERGEGYLMARKMMGWLQSPFIFMMLIIAVRLKQIGFRKKPI